MSLIAIILSIADALTPIFLLIMLGYGLKRLRFPGEGFWSGAEKLTYYVFFPCLLINKLSKTPLTATDTLIGCAILVGGMVLLGSITIIVQRFSPMNGRAFSSCYQGSIRFNSYMGFAVAAALYQESSLATVAMFAMAMVPAANILCVLVLQHYAADQPASIAQTVRSLLTNPLIAGCWLGLMLNISPVKLPGAVDRTLDILGSVALPLGLLTVGAALIISSIKRYWGVVLWSGTAKLIGLPIIAYLLCTLVGLDDVTTQLVLLLATLPTATSAYILARQMNGDADLMAIIISAQTLAAFVTMPLMLGVLRSL